MCRSLGSLNVKRPTQGLTLQQKHFPLPVDTGALYAEGDAQIDAGPARVRLTTVAAAGVARDDQDLLQGALSFD